MTREVKGGTGDQEKVCERSNRETKGIKKRTLSTVGRTTKRSWDKDDKEAVGGTDLEWGGRLQWAGE